MEILVYSRDLIEVQPAYDVPHLIVSINCPGEPPARIRTNNATLGRVNLFFWDIDHITDDMIIKYDDGTVPSWMIPDTDLAQRSDGEKIVALVDAHPEAQSVLVHCTAGRSRSAAVAAALHKVLNDNDAIIFNNGRYKPNMRVYRHVLEAWYDKHPHGE